MRTARCNIAWEEVVIDKATHNGHIPVFSHADVAHCFVYQSLPYEILADRGIEARKPNDGVKESLDLLSLSLADLLTAPGIMDLAQNSLAFLSEGAMLSDAKERMDATAGCQDIFVTEHGLPDEPVRGCLTEGELRRAAKI
jgi:hypothetical protein